MSLGPSNKITGPQFLPSFASSVLRSLAFTKEDQSILISGYHGADKKTLSYDLLSALLTHLEQHLPNLGSSILVVSELLDYLSHSDEESCGGTVCVTTLFINPTNLVLTAANISCLLLDTSLVSQYKVCWWLLLESYYLSQIYIAVMQVFQQKNGLVYVKSCLAKLGMEPALVQEVNLLLSVIGDLLSGTIAAQALSNIGILKFPDDVPSEQSLVQILYAYLVQWIGKLVGFTVIASFMCVYRFSLLGEFYLSWSW